jgi:hypothetical protein
VTRVSVLRAAFVCGAGACLAAVTIAVPATAAVAGETVTAHVATAHPAVGQDLDIDGQVTGAASSPSTVTVTRDDSAGQGQPVGMPVTTDPDGTFTVTDQPPVRGSVTYHLNAAGGAANTEVSTTVARNATDLTIHVSPSPVDVGSTVRVVAHVGSATTNRALTLYATPYGGSREEFDSGPVDANGDRTATRVIHRRTTLTAVFSGDDAYAPARASVVSQPRAVLTEKLRGGYATRDGYRLYHRSDTVNVFARLQPERKGACLIMRAQRHYGGAWHKAAVSDCRDDPVRTNSAGEVIAQLRPPHTLREHYRLRAEWRGNKAVAGRNGAWLHLEFR